MITAKMIAQKTLTKGLWE
jgi:hypothetical protein